MESATSFPLDKRSGKRFTLVLRAAKLVSPVGEFLCLLRNVSEGGVNLRLFHSMPSERPLQIELNNGACNTVEPLWQRGDQAGFRFVAGPIALTDLLGIVGTFPRRGVRLRAEMPVTVTLPDGARPALLHDISLDGARVDCERPFPLAARLLIKAERLPPIWGRVRWRKGLAHGIAFEHHFALDELARLLAPEEQSPAELAAKKAAC